MPRLVEVAAVEPQRILFGRLPHVALLALPGTWVLGGVRAQAPALSNLVSHLLRNQSSRPTVHGAVAGGQDTIRSAGQLGAVGEGDRVLVDALDDGTALQA